MRRDGVSESLDMLVVCCLGIVSGLREYSEEQM